MKKLLFLFILMLTSMLASANDGDTFSEETVEGVLLNYTIISESEKTCMVGYKQYPEVPTARNRRGPEENVSQVSGDITIPEEAKGYRVVQIETSAFEQTAITGVFIPNSVKTIGSYAFQMCVDLKSVRLSEQLTRIAGYTFYGCKSLTSIDIPEGVTSIGDYAFAGCEQLKDINIPSGVEQFGKNVFWNTGFTSLPKLPESLTVIPKGMFYECTQLTSIEIPENITMIDECAFGRCPISEIEIPASVTHVGVAAFANCKNITDLTIPDNVTEIGFNAFNGCSNLKTVKLSNNITSLNQGVFNECSSLESVIIPNGVKSIGKFAFEGCSSLGSINLPETLEEIGEQAFFGCSSLKQLFIPKNFVRFGKDENNTYWSFIYGCTSLTSIVVDKDNHVFDSRDNCNAIIETASNTLVAGCITTKIPEGITVIGSWAFGGFHDLTSITLPHSLNRIEQSAFNGSGLREIIIPENVTYIGAYAFSSCNSLKEFYCYAEKVPEAESSAFGNTNLKEVTLHVPAASVSAYQATKPWKNFKEIVALSPQDSNTNGSDYLPFVEIGKQWHVVSNPTNPYVPCSYERYEMYDEEKLNGKTYVRTGLFYDESDVEGFDEIGLFREENRRVYKYEAGRDVMMYDFSLKEGDTFTYEVGFDQPVNCKVLKQGWLEDGPQIRMLDSLTTDGAWTFKYRKLRTWTIGIDNGSGDYYEFITWIEYIGALRNMFSLPETVGRMSCLAYIERSDEYDYFYLPFSLYNMYGPIYGCNIPKMAADRSEKWDSQYTYELEGDRLHVFGKDVLNCVGDYYAYFTEKPTDDPLVHKLHFSIKEVGPQTTCSSLFTTDFSISGFNPNINYIIVDNYGEEHPVINKTPQMAYRPMIEEGKVWKVGTGTTIVDNSVQVVDYYYFDGDTIIGGKTCKQMMCQRYVSPNYSNEYWTPRPSLTKVGAWYEEDKKVYSFDERQQTMTLKYDFSLEANDTLHFLNVDDFPPFIIGPKQTGGIEGFKGVYRDIMMCRDEGQNIRNTTWLEGVGVRDAPFRNAYDPRADLVPEFLISCTVGDEVIYLNDKYEDGATPKEMGARKQRFDFSHTIKTKPKAPMRRGGEMALYGEYSQQQLAIHLNPLDDAYLVRITDETGKVVYEKAINAGSIVGLNIDISAYAKGRYTVTVENSNESFTGEFEAQTTGIEAIKTNREDVRNDIYNLHGQRLSSLQKGLNIVNGQKIYVK